METCQQKFGGNKEGEKYILKIFLISQKKKKYKAKNNHNSLHSYMHKKEDRYMQNVARARKHLIKIWLCLDAKICSEQ